MSSRRTKIRTSLLALLVSYLREATIVTTKFTTVSGVAGAYPFVPFVWTFGIDSNLFQAAAKELAEKPLPVGVTLQTSIERPDDGQDMPQLYMVDARILIRVPPYPMAESVAQQIALKVDQSLFRAGGKCEIKDYSQNPSVSTGSYLTWSPVPRGTWEMIETESEIEELEMRFQFQYRQPEGEW